MEYCESVRDVMFRQLDADGEVMQGTALRVQLPGASLCSEVTSAIRSAGQVTTMCLMSSFWFMERARWPGCDRAFKVRGPPLCQVPECWGLPWKIADFPGFTPERLPECEATPRGFAGAVASWMHQR